MNPVISLLLSVALAAIIGIEREVTHKPAGLRTHMLVSLGSCLFTLMSPIFGGQPAQIAGGVVAGIGFIGAGEYVLATIAAILSFVILSSKFLLERLGIEHKSH